MSEIKYKENISTSDWHELNVYLLLFSTSGTIYF